MGITPAFFVILGKSTFWFVDDVYVSYHFLYYYPTQL
jgi:hypothetical protein